MTHDLPWMIRGTNLDKQIQSSIKIHKFKLELGFLLTVLNPLSYFLLDLLAMDRIPQPFGVTLVPTLRQRLLSAISTSTHCMLSFDPASCSLVIFYWSVIHLFTASPISKHAQACWRECANSARCTAELSQNPSVPWTLLPMPAARAAQWRATNYRSTHVRIYFWTLRWRVRGRVRQESLRLSWLVVVLARYMKITYISPTSTIGKDVF